MHAIAMPRYRANIRPRDNEQKEWNHTYLYALQIIYGYAMALMLFYSFYVPEAAKGLGDQSSIIKSDIYHVERHCECF